LGSPGVHPCGDDEEILGVDGVAGAEDAGNVDAPGGEFLPALAGHVRGEVGFCAGGFQEDAQAGEPCVIVGSVSEAGHGIEAKRGGAEVAEGALRRGDRLIASSDAVAFYGFLKFLHFFVILSLEIILGFLVVVLLVPLLWSHLGAFGYDGSHENDKSDEAKDKDPD